MRDPFLRGRRLTTLAAALALFGGVGCGGANDDMKKQLRAMETQMTKLRADADRLEERLEAVELSTAVAARATRAAETEANERPRLKVIRLSPEDELPGEGAAPASAPPPPDATPQDDEGARPVIRGKGDNVIKTGASVQWRRDGIAGKSGLDGGRRRASSPRLSPPFPGMRGTRRVSQEG